MSNALETRVNTARNTLQRQLILGAVRELDVHATAEQVFEYIVQRHPTIGKATVYRNMRKLAQSGELLDIGKLHGAVHYDHNCREHHHFICNDCKRVFDVEGDFPLLTDLVRKTEQFQITGYNLTFYGLCRECGIE
ncbi:MAG: transcriptional repressor [Oscillospiraceae bacterium]|nr:transcriptional repressor [Oscillospiraceae bacterium]